MEETKIHIETVRIREIRKNIGVLDGLSKSLLDEGQRHPITLWTDGTLISGLRRLRCHYMLSGKRPDFQHINAVFVGTIEDAAKRLLLDMQDDVYQQKMTWSDTCRLWAMMRELDRPAAIQRADAARRRGVELRRKTQNGERRPGRSYSISEDYVLQVLAEPFGISAATARRAEIVFQIATGVVPADEKKKQLAVHLIGELDARRATVWPGYRQLMDLAPKKAATPAVKAEAAPLSADAQHQVAAWERALPHLRGLVSGLAELGPPNPDLTWQQVGPVHAQLAAVRRELEKMIKKMKETSQR